MLMAAPDRFDLAGADGARLAGFRLAPAGPVRGVAQIAHGMGEHFGRYHRLAGRLAGAGYAVYGQDHRGHGASQVHGLGDFGPGGFQTLVDDMAALSAAARREHPGAPFALVGHSMGSFASQAYLIEHGAGLDALALSGTAALDRLMAGMAATGGAPGLAALNAPFEPARTPFDWLSRDEAEVDAYLADRLCGFDVTPASLASMFALGAGLRSDPRLAAVRPDLPILVISGEFDPVTGPGQAHTNALIDGWRASGLTGIEHRVWPGGRHEMFNEINRAEVEDDLIAWLDAALTHRAR
jgi:alpha-beta hydrolase superfamily lysophospholipase